jgi:2-oxo-3-hexenedioate decarboxylase
MTMDLDAIAAQLKSAQDAGRQIEPFTSSIPGFDLAAAYEVARRIHGVRLASGARPVGRKIGFTHPRMWSLYGVREPVWGYVYDRTLVLPWPPGGDCALGRFVEPKIEPEVVLHFRAAPPLGGDAEAVLECDDWIAHGFEIVRSHFPGWRFGAADTVADQGLHGTLLVGDPRPVDRLGPDLAEQLANLRVTLLCDDEVRETGTGANALGSPLLAVAHLIAILETQPGSAPLGAGELITTGTLTAAFPVRPGEAWSTRIEGIDLPGLAVRFTP